MSLFTSPDRAVSAAARIALRHLDELRAAYTRATGALATFENVAGLNADRTAFASMLDRDGWIAVGRTAPAAFFVGADPLCVAFLENVDHVFTQGDLDAFDTWLDAVEEIGLVSPEVVVRGREIVATTVPADPARPVDLGDMELLLRTKNCSQVAYCYIEGDAVDVYDEGGRKFHSEPLAGFPGAFLADNPGEWFAGFPGTCANLRRPLTAEDRIHDIFPATLADGTAFFDGRVITDPEEILHHVNAQHSIIWGGRYHFSGDGFDALASEVLDYFGDPDVRQGMHIMIGSELRELVNDGRILTNEQVANAFAPAYSGYSDAPAGWISFEALPRDGRTVFRCSHSLELLDWATLRSDAPVIAFNPEGLDTGAWVSLRDGDGTELIAYVIGTGSWAVVDCLSSLRFR